MILQRLTALRTGRDDEKKDAETIAREAMAIAADTKAHTNGNLTVEELSE